MTSDEQQLVFRLVTEGMPKGEFLKRFRNSEDGVTLTTKLLKEGIANRNGADVEMALMVGFTFGFITEHLPLLVELEAADWHVRHEDVVSALGNLADVNSVGALHHSTQWIPEYLDFDESRALAVKAIWALGRIKGPESYAALSELVNDPDPILAELATEQIKRRRML
jgi:hypothetical protein